MTLVRAAVLTAKQVGVDRDWSVTKIQIKILSGREKTFPVVSGVQVGSRLQVISSRSTRTSTCRSAIWILFFYAWSTPGQQAHRGSSGRTGTGDRPGWRRRWIRGSTSRFHWVAVIAGPFHTFVIHVAGVFYRDELFIHQCGDVFYHSVGGQSGGICNGVSLGRGPPDRGRIGVRL